MKNNLDKLNHPLDAGESFGGTSRKVAEAITDAELIDTLERYIRKEPLVLWFGGQNFPAPGTGLSGLSLLEGGRTLREALRQLARGDR